ncbi:MFS transporter [Paraburkholderia strydomiana]
MSRQSNVVFQLIPFSVVAFLGFLAIGLPLPVLSLFVHTQLGYGTIVVGAVVGLQSASTLLTRRFAGRLSDRRGPKKTAIAGLLLASFTGALYLLAGLLAPIPLASLLILCAGRLVLGVAESLFITALSAWSIARVGRQHAGRAMAWSGIAMYSALAIGAPLGISIYRAFGFVAVAWSMIALPLFGAALAMPWRKAEAGSTAPSVGFLSILRTIWLPGLAMALASSGVGTISSFLPLHFAHKGWPHVGTALAAFGAAYILVRISFGGLPDRFGGYRIAIASLVTEMGGLFVIAVAHNAATAFAGTLIVGLGYSLVFPSLGVEAIRRVKSESQGVVISAYLACFDLGLAAAGPGAGAVARSYGIRGAFVAAAFAAASASGMILTDFFRRKRICTGHKDAPCDLPARLHSDCSQRDNV